MPQLLRDPRELQRLIIANCPRELIGEDFDADEWLANRANFALRSGDDLSLWEADEWPGPLTVHVMFSSRGKQALGIARMMLDQAWSYGPTAIIGEVPAHTPHVLKFARLLGFVPYGEAERKMGRVILTKLSRPVNA